jgi:putative aldouronate transport system permease protein
MKIKSSLGDNLFSVVNVICLVGLMVLCVYPLLYVGFASLSDPLALMRYRGLLLRPLGLTFDAYRLVLENPMVLLGYRNTLLYVVGGTALNLVMTTLGAYALSRRHLLLKNSIMFMIVFTMFFNGGLIPTFLLVGNTLNLMDNPLALIIPVAISTYNLIVMRTAFEAVPIELEEAARIDGANDLQILWRIYLPLCKPVLAVMTLFYAVAHWNSFFPAMVYLRSREWYPLQLVLREILITNSTETMLTGVSSVDVVPIGETIKYATIVVATLPILCVYPLLQRYFTKGVMIGAIKG